MALTEDIIFSDPVLQRIFFDERRLAARFKQSAGHVAGIEAIITQTKIEFQKEKSPGRAEQLQRLMRMEWFAARALCDGYFIKPPPGFSDKRQHVELFAHDAGSACLEIDARARTAYWYKYAQQAAPVWGAAGKYRPRRRRRRR